MTDDDVTKAAIALRAEAEKFDRPVEAYVEGEALWRWEKANPSKEEPSDIDFELESWKILARAALEAVK